ncbi:molybdopterin biosynthesis protein [Desulfatiferula olefinivorans]
MTQDKDTLMTVKRNVYLDMKSIEQALDILMSRVSDPGKRVEQIDTASSVGRILAEPVSARLSSPAFHAAAMDGFAVRAEDTFGAHPGRPRDLEIGIGAFPVNTGHVMPPSTNAVIMIEMVVAQGEQRIRIEAPAFPWQYVRKTGEDIVATEMLFAHGHRLTPYCIGALISGGVFRVPVVRKPRLLVIPTGSELVDYHSLKEGSLRPGQVIDSNSHVLTALGEACGAQVTRHPHVIDDPERIGEVVGDAAKNDDIDMILLVGGSSAGSQDFSRHVLETRGEVWVHGVTMMPGKPLLFGQVGGTPVFGIPGYPVSAIVAFEQFVQPLIHRMIGWWPEPRKQIDASPIRKITSKLGIEEFVRVKIGKVGERLVATPIPGGAGSITSITQADGIIRIPAQTEGLSALEPVRAELLKPLATIENTLVIVGSHDNTLDVLADQIRRSGNPDQVTVSSSHVGSMGGLMALKKGLCHLAGSHLLDESDGTYNLSYIRKHLPDKPVRVVNLVLRDQGLIVPKGNPKGILGIDDLCRPDIRFINRQAGSGTRILLDYKLREQGLDHKLIDGYQLDEYTHMAVAVAVLSGAADVGLGIYAAARALDLDFIPVVTEQYDLVIDQAFMDSPMIRTLLDTIEDPAFQNRVLALGGYSTEKTGTVIL